MDFYRPIRPLLFRLDDAETTHRRALNALEWVAEQPWAGVLDRLFSWNDPRLTTRLWGLDFANPLGLAAGFDKNAQALGAWQHLGFGFAEVGTVTRHPQPGNPLPRLFRLEADQAVINRMGFNNDGADALAHRLAGVRSAIPVGVNLGKSKLTPLQDAADDYLYSFTKLYALGDYFVVNVSSPNTPGLRELQQADRLGEILGKLQLNNPSRKPLLVKIAPDLDWAGIDAVIDLCSVHQLAGVIATNTTVGREGLRSRVHTQETGGLSGAPLARRSTEVIAHIWKRTGGRLPIVGVGGIFSGADAWEKIVHGASLVQVYTGWVYEGPSMARRILKTLAYELERAGLERIDQAVGRAVQ